MAVVTTSSLGKRLVVTDDLSRLGVTSRSRLPSRRRYSSSSMLRSPLSELLLGCFS